MINNDLLSKVQEVINELDRLEKHYRIEGSKAYEIEDQAVFQATQLETYNKMKEIREWKVTATGLSAAISEQIGKIQEEEEEEEQQERLEDKNEERQHLEIEKPNQRLSFPVSEPIKETPVESKMREIEETEIKVEYDEQTKEEPEMDITLTMFNTQYPLKYWSAVLVKVCQVVLVKRPFVIARLSQEKSLYNPGGANFSYIKSDIKNSPRRLHNGLWIELDRTADEVLEVVDTITKLGGYKENAITVEYK